MAKTVNETINDLLVRHSVGVQRLSSTILNKIIRLLNQADIDIVKKLESRGATLAGTLTSQRLAFLLKAIRQINHDAYVKVGMELRAELRDLAKYEAQFQVDLFKKVIPVAIDYISPSANLLSAVVTSKPFQGMYLRDLVRGLEAHKLRNLTNAIRLGMVEGETTAQIIQRVRGTQAMNFKDGVLETTRTSAERMVRTATNHVANAARQEVYAANPDLVSQWQFVATLDTSTCEECAGLDGQVFDVGEGSQPPIHLNCRCSSVPIVASWKSLGINLDEAPAGTRASMDGQVSATETYQSWLSNQSAAVQDEALGPTRGALFREGGVTIDRFTNRNGDNWTIDQLRTREAAAFAKL